MENAAPAWTGQQFRNRLTVLSHAAVIMTLVTIWLINWSMFSSRFSSLSESTLCLSRVRIFYSKEGFPIMLSYITMLMLAILIVLGAGFFAYQQAATFLDDEERMDEYTLLLDERWADLKEAPLIGKSILDSGATLNGTLDNDLVNMGLLDEGSGVTEAFGGLLSSVGVFFITGVTVLFFLLFIILKRVCYPGGLNWSLPRGGASGAVFMIRDQIESSVNTYVVVKTGVGFGTGVCAGLVMLLFGIDLWFTWALLTFLLNYVPYIGSLLATIPPIVLGFILPRSVHAHLVVPAAVNESATLGEHHRNTLGWASLEHLSGVVVGRHCVFFLGLGHHRHDLVHPVGGDLEDRSREHRRHPPLAILLSGRAPTLEEAWREAIKDGRITAYEERMLNELQTALGYNDEQVKLISARIAAEYALRRGRLSVDQITLIRVGIANMRNPKNWRERSLKKS